LTLTLTAVLLAVVPIAAAGSQPTVLEQREASNQTTAERIDGNTVIVGSEYRANESVALLTLRSEIYQGVTVSDAGAFSQGGTVPVRVAVFEAGETATVEIPVTEVDGRVGLAISTEQTPLYSELIVESGNGLDILAAVSSLQAWLAGAFVAFVWFAIAGYQVLRGEEGRPEVAS
jgi:hypothetical protein